MTGLILHDLNVYRKNEKTGKLVDINNNNEVEPQASDAGVPKTQRSARVQALVDAERRMAELIQRGGLLSARQRQEIRAMSSVSPRSGSVLVDTGVGEDD